MAAEHSWCSLYSQAHKGRRRFTPSCSDYFCSLLQDMRDLRCHMEPSIVVESFQASYTESTHFCFSSFYIALFRLLAGICPLKPKLMGRRGQRNGLHRTVHFSENPRIAQERKLAVEGTRVGCVMSYITAARSGGLSFIYRQRWTTELRVT